jgi:hypothetical protein
MRRFFNKRAIVVDVTDKEVIDLFQDGLYHCRTIEDFGHCCLSSITKLKDMITSLTLLSLTTKVELTVTAPGMLVGTR